MVSLILLILSSPLLVSSSPSSSSFTDSPSTTPSEDSSCGESILSLGESRGLITSPSWPAHTPPIRCHWNITTDYRHALRLRWLRMDLPARSTRSSQCLDAYVMTLWPDRAGRVHASPRRCEKDLPESAPTLRHSIQIELIIDRSMTSHLGFAVEYFVVPEEEVRPSRECASEKGNHSGRIWSPGWPGSYLTNSSCEWLIRVPPEQIIFVQVLFVHMSPAFEDCERVQMTIQDGYLAENGGYSHVPGTTTGGAIDGARFCGPSSNYQEEGAHSFLSTSNRLLVRFRSDDRPPQPGERFGFRLSWTAVEAVQEEPSYGSFSSAESADSLDSSATSVCSLPCAAPVCIEHSQGMCSSRARLCVNASLACDGHADCPFDDYSDERGCTWRETALAGGIAGAVLALLLLLALCLEHRRRKLCALSAARHALHAEASATNALTPPRQHHLAPSSARHTNNNNNNNSLH